MLVIDLKVWPKNAYNPPADKLQEELSNEYRPNCFFAGHRLSSHALISKLCKTVSRKPEDKILYLLRSVYVHGFRPDDLSRKPSGYRSLPQSPREKALPYGHSGHCSAKYTGACQQSQGLANLRRFRAISDQNRQAIISRRRIGSGAGQYSLRTGFIHHRSLSEHISLGGVSRHKSSDKAPYPFGPARQHTGFHSYLRRQSPRCKHPGSDRFRTRKLLCHGSCLRGLHKIVFHESAVGFFVTRAKSNLKFRRIYSHPIDKATGLKCDQTITLTGVYTSKQYPDKLRRIKFHDAETGKILVFLTNNFSLPPIVITELYRSRWQVELFFKWIKQNLRIKAFYGTTENAVKTQIWIAVSVYVLVAIIKKRLNTDMSLYTMLQILSITIFEKIPLNQLFKNTSYENTDEQFYKQLKLFN